MIDGISKAEGIFGRCTTCIKNMMISICSMTCAPDHSRFLESKVIDKYVSEIKFKIDEKFIEGVYNSCSGVIQPATGRLAMDFTCRPYEAKTCDAKKWYKFMGDPKINEYVPFHIDYVYDGKPEEQFTGNPLPCNEAYNGSYSYACSCIDCAKSCPIGEPPEEDKNGFQVLHLNGIAFIISLLIGFLGICSTILSFIFFRKSHIEFGLPKICGGCDHVHYVLSKIFCFWGKFCAKNPVLVLALCSWLIGFFAYGIRFMQITTEPVELWASKNSPARLDKEYFDSRFGPFYRTNQVFIKPIKKDNVSIIHKYS